MLQQDGERVQRVSWRRGRTHTVARTSKPPSSVLQCVQYSGEHLLPLLYCDCVAYAVAHEAVARWARHKHASHTPAFAHTTNIPCKDLASTQFDAEAVRSRDHGTFEVPLEQGWWKFLLHHGA